MEPRTLVGRPLRSGWRVTAATLDDGPGGRERWTSAAPRRVNGRSSSLRGAPVKRCSEAAMPALFRGRARLGRHRRPSDTPRWTSDVVWMSGSQSRRFLEVWSPQMHTCIAQPCNTSRARLVRWQCRDGSHCLIDRMASSPRAKTGRSTRPRSWAQMFDWLCLMAWPGS